MNKFLPSLLQPATTAVVFFLAISGYALAAEHKKADTHPQSAVTEHSCCDPKGTCLPANPNSVCPDGYIKVSQETCEKGERGCDL